MTHKKPEAALFVGDPSLPVPALLPAGLRGWRGAETPRSAWLHCREIHIIYMEKVQDAISPLALPA